MPKKKKKAKKIKSVSFKPEKVNYDKVKHATSVDQSDRHVPVSYTHLTLPTICSV